MSGGLPTCHEAHRTAETCQVVCCVCMGVVIGAAVALCGCCDAGVWHRQGLCHCHVATMTHCTMAVLDSWSLGHGTSSTMIIGSMIVVSVVIHRSIHCVVCFWSSLGLRRNKSSHTNSRKQQLRAMFGRPACAVRRSPKLFGTYLSYNSGHEGRHQQQSEQCHSILFTGSCSRRRAAASH